MRIRIHPAFIGYLLCQSFLSASWEQPFSLLLALLSHEVGHCFLSFLYGERIRRIELTPFGGVIHYDNSKSPCKGIKGLCIAAAGPLSNYIALLVVSANKPLQNLLGESLSHSIVVSNFSMMLLNLLPVFPLDGGRMVFSLGFFLFPTYKLISCLSFLGILSGLILILLAFIGFARFQMLNCSLLLIGGYIAFCAAQSKRQAMAENLYSIVHDRLRYHDKQISRIQIYHVPHDIRLLELLLPMERAEHAVFVYEKDCKERIIRDHQICQMLLEKPSETLYYADSANYQKSNDN